MGRKLALDFGTTNTVVAEWRAALEQAETLRLPGVSAPPVGEQPPIIPTLLYVEPGGNPLIGQAVRTSGNDTRSDPRFFRSFKRGIIARRGPLPRQFDDTTWNEARAGAAFLQSLLERIIAADPTPVEELVLTVPIQSFEAYLNWLFETVDDFPVDRVRIIDEPTAAALGYGVKMPGALVLVFDFGGGTLDVSLVRMPPEADSAAGVIYDVGRASVQNPNVPQEPAATVIAKAAHILGGDDIDLWMVQDVLEQNGVAFDAAGDIFPEMKLAVEAAKIRLSSEGEAAVGVLDLDEGRTYSAEYTRSSFEDLLDKHGFYGRIQQLIDKVLRGARQDGIYKEDIDRVLMVGGSSLIPSVQRILRMNFGDARVETVRPFEAVAHGAVGLAVGARLDDFLYHSYGLRHLSPITGQHEYESLIHAGSRYPLQEPITFTLCAAHREQTAIEMVIGEVEENATGLAEVYFGDHHIVLMEDGVQMSRVVPLNDSPESRVLARLDPPGRPGEDRIRVAFTVDENRFLRVTVTDLVPAKDDPEGKERVLLRDVAVVQLR